MQYSDVTEPYTAPCALCTIRSHKLKRADYYTKADYPLERVLHKMHFVNTMHCTTASSSHCLASCTVNILTHTPL